jgi:hypothetical protein
MGGDAPVKLPASPSSGAEEKTLSIVLQNALHAAVIQPGHSDFQHLKRRPQLRFRTKMPA